MNAQDLYDLANKIIAGHQISPAEAQQIAQIPEADSSDLQAQAHRINQHFKGNTVHTCTILNGKSGKCSEDCGFCTQSISANCEDVEYYPLMSPVEMQEAAQIAVDSGVDRFSVVTAGKGLSTAQVQQVADAFAGISAPGGMQGEIGEAKTRWCASLGIIPLEKMRLLKDAGVSRYHHNLETARSHFGNVVSTHSYDDRIATIKAAHQAGMTVCAGGIFGLGESDAQAVEMALELRDLQVESVPLNFLLPAAGTKLAHIERLTPLRCLKLVAIYRMILPRADILICGGREDNLQELHPLLLLSGANGIMTGNYLTREGRTLKQDKALLDALQVKHGLKLNIN
ncbi:MAG: biotin synthase BioB [Fibrobacter sp.]|nr:biotin synthase BioB [Fibrobacter sp.]